MLTHYNPYHLHSGIFVPHYLLSSSDMSHGAKLLYSLLASKADSRGAVLLNVALMAAEMGEEEHGIFRLMNELDTRGLIRTERHPAGTQFIRCSFPQPAWLLNSDTSAKSGKLSQIVLPDVSIHSSPSPSFELFDTVDQPEQKIVGTLTQSNFRPDVTRHAQSRYSFEDCYRYALACRQAGQRIKSPYHLAKALNRTGEQDDEIALFLASGQKRSRLRAA